MGHDSDYFRRRAAEVRSSAFLKDEGESVEVAGHLALAYAALARRRETASPVDPLAVSVPDPEPLMLRD